jgi:hypothetical protein
MVRKVKLSDRRNYHSGRVFFGKPISAGKTKTVKSNRGLPTTGPAQLLGSAGKCFLIFPPGGF